MRLEPRASTWDRDSDFMYWIRLVLRVARHGGEIDGRPAVQQLRGAAVAIGDCAARGAATWQQRLREPAAARWTSSDARRGACRGGGDCAKAAAGLLDGGGQRHGRTGRERGGGCAAGLRGGAAEQRWRASVATRRNAVRRLEGRQRRRRRGSGGAGEAAAVTRLRRRQRGGALSTGRMRDFDEIATTRWRAEDIQRATKLLGTSRASLQQRKLRRWEPSDQGKVKLNCDAAVDITSGQAAVASPFCDDHVNFTLGS
ncbi:hypothetical protein Scep_002512 [Stephania cephalantha]|uniref:Uncharacterized protein n=1 Tax=Stephania cephalantha TaxID=152367 RepID=A0AAP0Q8V0_9MAGN